MFFDLNFSIHVFEFVCLFFVGFGCSVFCFVEIVGSMAGLVSGLQVTKAAGLVESPIFQNPQEPFEDSKVRH